MSKIGFIQLPRSFYDDPIWKTFSLEERSIFTAIFINAAWEETTQDDFGVLCKVKPGQLLMTQRALISEAFPETQNAKLLNQYKSSVVRALAKFETYHFSYHKTYHKKTLHTIVRNDILEMIVPNFEPDSYQARTTKEEVNNENNIRIKETNKEKTQKVVRADFRSLLLNKEEIQTIMAYSEHHNFNFKENDVIKWLKKHGMEKLLANLKLLMNNKNTNDHTKWLQAALTRGYLGEKANIIQNKKWITLFKTKYEWNNLTITEAYCRDEETGIDFQFKLPISSFQEIIKQKYKIKQGII